MIFSNSFLRFDSTERKVVLAGGNTLLPGFRERLARDANLEETDPNFWGWWGVFDNPDRKEAVWIGGSIYASLREAVIYVLAEFVR